MKRIIFAWLSIVILLSACGEAEKISPPIPMDKMDGRFNEYLLENFDLNKDGVISVEEAALVKEIICFGRGIRSMDGIQYFPNLEKLDCSLNSIQELDVSGCHALDFLNCSFSNLNSIKINPQLKILDIRNNYLVALDFSGNKYLKDLYCGSEYLKLLDVSNSVLDSLDCSYSRSLISFNIDGCNMLKSLNCVDGLPNNSLKNSSLEKLTTNTSDLDVSGCPKLKTLNYGGGFGKLDLSKNTELENLRLTNFGHGIIDVSKNFKLINFEIDIFARYGQLVYQDIDLSNHKALKKIYINWEDKRVTGGTWGTLNLSGCTALETVSIRLFDFESINATGCSSLSSLICEGIVLSELNLTGCSSLKTINCGGNGMAALNLKDCRNLETFRWGWVSTALDFTECPKLTYLYCSNIQLTELDINNCKNLTELYVYGNKLTSLNVNSENLSKINCGNNPLTALGFPKNNRIKELYCTELSIATLDLSGYPLLEKLDCSSNSLSKLDLSQCPNLTYLDCHSNLMESLDVSKCPKLAFINCRENLFQPSLNVSMCQLLSEIDCSNNPDLKELIISQNQLVANNIKIYKDTRTEITVVK